MVRLKLEARYRDSMRLVFCTCVLLPKVIAFSISVQNGSFEVGMLDVQIALRIKPLPQDVRNITFYHCCTPEDCSAFYEVDILENREERTGELGERTSHVVVEKEHEYIITLLITNPKDTDQGEYCCVVRRADGGSLQGNMRLTKLEALREISGTNITLGDANSEMSLVIRMFPSNVTLYWVKCFHSFTPEPSAHFYTYDMNVHKVIAAGDLGTRTSHRCDVKKKALLLSLIIQNPGPSDAGPYCCQVDAVGLPEPRLVIMWMKLVATSSNSVIEIGTVTNKKTTTYQGEVPHESSVLRVVVTLLTFSLLITTGLSFYFYWKRRNQCKKQERNERENLQLFHNSDSGGKI